MQKYFKSSVHCTEYTLKPGDRPSYFPVGCFIIPTSIISSKGALQPVSRSWLALDVNGVGETWIVNLSYSRFDFISRYLLVCLLFDNLRVISDRKRYESVFYLSYVTYSYFCYLSYLTRKCHRNILHLNKGNLYIITKWWLLLISYIHIYLIYTYW